MRCSVLQRVAACCSDSTIMHAAGAHDSWAPCVAACCSVLQRVAVLPLYNACNLCSCSGSTATHVKSCQDTNVAILWIIPQQWRRTATHTATHTAVKWSKVVIRRVILVLMTHVKSSEDTYESCACVCVCLHDTCACDCACVLRYCSALQRISMLQCTATHDCARVSHVTAHVSSWHMWSLRKTYVTESCLDCYGFMNNIVYWLLLIIWIVCAMPNYESSQNTYDWVISSLLLYYE